MENSDFKTIKYVPPISKDEKSQQFIPENDDVCETWYLRYTVLTGLFLIIFGGTTIGWFSPALIKLHSNNTEENPIGRPITTFETSQLLGISGMVSLIGALLLPKLADYIGRKNVLFITGITMLMSIVGVAFGKSIIIIVTFESCVNIGFMAVLAVMPMYLAEICDNNNRAKYGCLMPVCLPVGQLYTFFIGSIFSYKMFTLLTAVPLVVFLLLFGLAPETPVYHLTKKRHNECRMTLKKLRSNKSDEQLEKDFNHIRESVEEAKKNKQNNFLKLFKRKEGRIGLMLSLLPIIIQFFSGVPVIMPLLAPLFQGSGSSVSGHTISIAVGAVKIAIFTVPFFLVERTGRKPLLIISAIGAGISVAVLGYYFYLKSVNSPLITQLHWVPLVFVILFVGTYAIGLGPIPISIMSELFLSDLRSTANALTTIITNTVLTIYISAFPFLLEILGIHWCMWIFSGTCFIGAIMIHVILPETRGKSVLEIQEILRNY